jgi:hypothetical protein
VEMKQAVCDFLGDDILEAYLLGRLPGQQKGMDDDPEVQSIEEHLLWCEVCQAKAETQENEIKALRAALLACAPAKPKRNKAKVLAIGMVIGRTY